MQSIIFVFISCLLVSSMAFSPSKMSRKSTSISMANEYSKALPFLKRPAKLDGSGVGDFGFDPLGFTEVVGNYNYVQAAEIKHGRVAMLAVVGFIVQQYIHIVSSEANPLKAITDLGYGPNLQILFGIGAVELATWEKTFSGTEAAGDLGFDPLGQLKGKSQSQVNDLKLKELKNGRLAMIAIMGIVIQYILFDGKATLSF